MRPVACPVRDPLLQQRPQAGYVISPLPSLPVLWLSLITLSACTNHTDPGSGPALEPASQILPPSSSLRSTPGYSRGCFCNLPLPARVDPSVISLRERAEILSSPLPGAPVSVVSWALTLPWLASHLREMAYKGLNVLFPFLWHFAFTLP